MRRIMGIGLVLLALSGCAPYLMDSNTSVGFRLDVRSAPPPPRVYWSRPPDVVVIPNSRVYVVEGVSYDIFLYSGSYYLCNDGYWYQSRSAEGPFAVLDVRSVPGPVLSVPDRHWKRHPHGRPPGQERKDRRERS